MKKLNHNKKNGEIIISSMIDFNLIENLSELPTICLVASNDPIPKDILLNCTLKAISAGVTHFLTCGAEANKIHEYIDSIIETSKEDLTHILTTGHQEDSDDELSWFFLNATFFGKERHRYLILLNPDNTTWSSLINKILSEISG